MNTATENLENDHVYILRLTEVMQQMTKKKATDIDHFKSVVQIIRKYADGLHHKKEEDLLFPLFEQKGAGSGCGPVGVMLMEHKQGRIFVQGMLDGIAQFENGDEKAIQKIYDNMLDYAGLLQNHIYKENNILFRMADDVFNDDDQETLLKQFDKIESGAREGEKIEDFVTAIATLEKIYKA
jgi:hemerythrin-like domain-containing protein